MGISGSQNGGTVPHNAIDQRPYFVAIFPYIGMKIGLIYVAYSIRTSNQSVPEMAID